MTAPSVTDLIFDGTAGYVLTREHDTVTLSHASARTVLPIANINALTYRSVRYPFFFVLGVLLLLGTLYLVFSSPYLFSYDSNPFSFRFEPPAYPLVGAVVSFLLFYFLESSSVVIYSGSFRGSLKGSAPQLAQAMELLSL